MKILSKLLQCKSAFFLIAANLVALIFCLVGGWGAFDIMFLYWCESAVIGFYNVLRIISRMGWLLIEARNTCENVKQKTTATLAFSFATIFITAFFCVHFGGFMFGHLFFISVFFESKIAGEIFKLIDPLLSFHLYKLALTFYTLALKAFSNYKEIVLVIASLFVSHGYSFFANFIRNKEYINVNMEKIMKRPYGRIAIMHLSVLFGGFLFWLIPFFPAFLLIVIKTIADIKLHLKERDILSKATDIDAESPIT